MKQIGPGVREVRVKQGNNTARCLYVVAGQPAAVWVLHAFLKKDQRTPEQNKATARQRLNAAMDAMKDQR
jgi:phage-related protein